MWPEVAPWIKLESSGSKHWSSTWDMFFFVSIYVSTYLSISLLTEIRLFRTWNQPINLLVPNRTMTQAFLQNVMSSFIHPYILPPFQHLPTILASLVFATLIGHLFDVTLHLWRQVFFSRSVWGYVASSPANGTQQEGGCVYISSNVHLSSSIFLIWSVAEGETSWQRPSSNPVISEKNSAACWWPLFNPLFQGH